MLFLVIMVILVGKCQGNNINDTNCSEIIKDFNETWEKFHQELEDVNSLRYHVICPALMAVGIIGTLANSLTIIILLIKPRLRCLSNQGSSSNFFLGSAFYQMLGYLAVFDLTTAMCAVWREVAKSVYLKTPEPAWNVYARIYLVTPLWYISLNASILMTVALATERYLAVTRPLAHRANRSTLSRTGNGHRDSSRGTGVALRYFLGCLALAFALGLARFFEFRIIERPNEFGNDTYLVVDATELRDSRAYYTGHSLAKLALMGIVPFVLLIVFNLGICRALWNKQDFAPDYGQGSQDSSKFTGTRRQQQQLQSSSKQKSLILFAIILVFVVTNLPRFIADIAEIISIDNWDDDNNVKNDSICQMPPKKPPKWFLVLIIYSEFLLVLNASVNFFVYALTAKPFRNQIVTSFWCRRNSA